VKFHLLRSFLVLLLALSAGILSSCGGGGANSTANAPTGGLVHLIPETGTFYAGIPYTFQIVGGRPPYSLSSSEPSLFPVPLKSSDFSFTVVPNNPGVFDLNLPPDALLVRSVNLQVRDSTGDLRNSTIQVAQNFLTGYGVLISPPTTCSTGSVCAGGESAVLMQATFAGNLHGNQPFRFEVLRGNFSLRNPATGQVANAITMNSDHTGTIVGPFIVVPPGVPTQLAVLRVIHVPTGVYADTVFTIVSTGATSGLLVAIPDTFNFKGALQGQCGTGTADFFVFDGVPPYTAVSSSFAIQVTPVSNSQPGRFTITANRQDICVDATIIVTDSNGARDTITVTTEEGDTAPPTPPEPADLVVGPTAITLGCGESGSVTVVGGTGQYFTNSTNANVTAVVSGNTVTITRTGAAPGVGSSVTGVSISDGSQIVNVAVTAPATCL
jgi:hypothetical protein